MLCLVCRLSVEDEWSKANRDRALSIDGGPMWFKSSDRFVVNLRPGGATRGKVENIGWEGRREECCHVRSSEGGSPRLSRLRTDRLALMSKNEQYWCMRDLWCPVSRVALMVAELDDTSPFLQ